MLTIPLKDLNIAGIYTTLADLRRAEIGNVPYTLVTPSGRVEYSLVSGDFTGKVDNDNVIALNSVPLTTGALVKQTAKSVNFDGRSVEVKLLEIVSVTDKRFAGGAKGDGVTNDTAAIQAAIDSGAAHILFPSGQYLFDSSININTSYQRLSGAGAKLTRAQANVTVNVNARGVHFDQLRFGCQTSGIAGNNITVNAPDFRALFCESRDCNGRALLILNSGGGAVIQGGVYQTTNTTTSGYDIEIRDDVGGGNTLYCAISQIITNQAQGGILISGEVGSMSITCSQFGKLRMENGGASKVSNCRINSTSDILSSFATFENNEFNDDIVFGLDGATPNIGSIRFANTNVQKAGKQVKVSNNVVESTFHLGQMASAGSVVAITGWNNDIWLPAQDITVTLGAQTGSPTVGNGTVVAKMSSEGRRRFVSVDFTLGSTSNLGTGNFFYIILPFKARTVALGDTQVTDAGAGFYTMTARQLAGSNEVYFFPTSGGNTPVTNGASSLFPFTWAAGDRLILTINAEQTV